MSIFKYCLYGVIQLLSLVCKFIQVLAVDGAVNVCCNKDLYFPFFVVRASFDKASARVLSPLGMCCIVISSKLELMISRTK